MTRKELLSVGLIIGIVGVVSAFAVMSARERARDVTRLAHVRELQIGLELFFNQNGTYPLVEEETPLGETTTACLSEDGFGPPCTAEETQAAYIEFVPSPPATGLKGRSSCADVKNAYCYDTDGATFHVQFELEKANALLGLTRGVNCATETGFESGACPAYK
jgi:hypothetical protein